MATRTIGPFRIEKQLGVGGMGIVYQATYTKTGQAMAVKVLAPNVAADKQLLKRFEREMSILKRLRHEHIVRYYGGGQQGSQSFYAMELMSGGSLAEILQEKGRLAWERSIDYGIQIAKALEHAHEHGIIHRDLKPANLFVDDDGRLKLGDFGIARDTEATALTAAGRTVGTYAYMAPEQISGKQPLSRKTDLYSLGCVLFEMLTGRTPFQAKTPAEMLFQHLEQEPPRVTAAAIDCPIWLESVIMKLLAKEPDDRYYDALAVQMALEDVGQMVAQQASVARQTAAGGLSGSTVAKDGGELKRLLGRKKKKKKKESVYEQAWFLAAVLLLLIGGIIWGVWPAGDEQLFAHGQALFEGGETAARERGEMIQWLDARDKYFKPLLARSPDGPFAAKAGEYIDEIEMEIVRGQIMKRFDRGSPPRDDAERLFIDALKFERFGDRISALEKYRNLVTIFDDEDSKRVLVNLARRQVSKLESEGVRADERLRLVNETLLKAEELLGSGREFDAHAKWQSVVDLYGTNREFQQHVQFARDRLDRKDVELPDFLREQPPAEEGGWPSAGDPPDDAPVVNGQP